jgi:hypothetical protein
MLRWGARATLSLRLLLCARRSVSLLSAHVSVTSAAIVRGSTLATECARLKANHIQLCLAEPNILVRLAYVTLDVARLCYTAACRRTGSLTPWWALPYPVFMMTYFNLRARCRAVNYIAPTPN